MENKASPINASNLLGWIDDLRVLATIRVVFLYVSASTTAPFGKISSTSWMIAAIYNSFVRFCVLVFVMIKGASLLPITYEINNFIKKKLFRFVVPLVFWGCIYILFLVLIKVSQGFKSTFLETIQYVYEVIKNGIYPHFWYVYMIIGLYLFIYFNTRSRG